MARICQRCSHHNEDHAKFCLSCGAMLEVDADENAGDPLIGRVLLGRYRPVSVLGEGGMGKVYEAEQKMGTATRKVAIKTLHPELSGDPQLVARFHRESETVIELRHPNTIQFYDFGELDDGTLIIVMEYIQGKPLSDVGAIDAARADKIIIQICGSLHEAHQRGIVHRDLKPDNVLLTNQGGQSDFVKVLDFGIAKKDDAEDANQAKLTKQGMVLGTPPYMSPEQFSGQVLDARSDVYSLGVMVYEMLTGHLPFEASTPWEWATKHLTAEPHPIEAHPAGAALPQNKKAAIMRALAKSRDDRQEGVLAFLQEFTGYEDANSAWTMATSAGGPVVAGQGQARGPAPTPGPMPQTAAGFAHNPTPPPGYGSAPGVSAAGYSQAGHSAPGMAPHSFGGMGSAPGYPPGQVPGAPSQHGYASYAQPAQSSGGAMGKILVLGVIGLFILGGAGGGLAWWASQSDDDEEHADTTTTTPTPPTNPPVAGGMQPLQPNNTGVPTTPTTPMQPLQPNTPTTPTAPTPTPPTPTPTPPATPETPPETPPERPTRPTRPRGPSPADEARARSLVANGLGAAQRNDFRGAVAALQGAQRAVGRRHPSTQQLRSELQRRGSNQVGILLQQGRCGQAQALYRQLNSVGAGGDARRQFGDWCPAR